jgi:hypothetical protein
MPNPYTNNQTAFVRVPDPPVPVFVADDQNLLTHINPLAGGPLTFRTHGIWGGLMT